MLLSGLQSLGVQNYYVCTHRRLLGTGSLQQPYTLNKFQQAKELVRAASCTGPLMKAHLFLESDSAVASCPTFYIAVCNIKCFLSGNTVKRQF